MEKINEEALREARTVLQKYKDGKRVLEARVKEEEKWYRLRHWEVMQGEGDTGRPQPTSAWLFNAIMNKHADAMDNFPECSVLPREDGDRADAKTLSAIIPVILERCEFEKAYSYNWWEKLKHGTAIYGSFWNPRLENGLGDVDVKPVDILNIFWEPGIQDIQESRNVFVLDLRDNDLLEQEYPQLEGKLGGEGGIDLAQYEHDPTLDLTGKSAVVDWYYKVRTEEGRTLVHYVKFVGDTLLFASENEAEYADRGFYDHGKYPFVFDALFPEKGTPCGFGYVALCKDPQMYIDKLSQAILENALRAGKKRWFIGAQTGVNKEQFLDWNSDFVDVEGSSNLDDTHMREITTTPLPGSALNILQMKVDELKETTSNRDVSSGGAIGGVTAAAAITALQEAGNKTSRDMIGASYRAYTQLDYLIIELVRQFYDRERSFRITGGGAQGYDFVRYQQYKAQYERGAQQAMQDTMGQVMTRTGGLASSFAQTAGQQSYNATMAQLADKVPELRQLAYQMYRDEGDRLRSDLQMYDSLDSSDASRWQATVLNPFQVDRAYAKDVEDTLYSRGRDALADQRYEQEWAYKEKQDQEARDKAVAELLASGGNYSGYEGLYGMSPEDAAALGALWTEDRDYAKKDADLDLLSKQLGIDLTRKQIDNYGKSTGGSGGNPKAKDSNETGDPLDMILNMSESEAKRTLLGMGLSQWQVNEYMGLWRSAQAPQPGTPERNAYETVIREIAEIEDKWGGRGKIANDKILDAVKKAQGSGLDNDQAKRLLAQHGIIV